uniref:Uncharacterized protein n=1 Tax=Anguilla anguilla TaxID=7936 RepID=A0A0E9V074_ANGAN
MTPKAESKRLNVQKLLRGRKALSSPGKVLTWIQKKIYDKT